MADVDYNIGLVLDAIDELGIARNTIVFWCTDNGAESAPAVARFVRPVERLLQHGDGRRHSHAVHHPLAGPDSRRPGVERDRPPDRYLPDARRRRRRRHRPEGPRDRRRESAAVPRGQAAEVESRQRDLLHRTRQLRAVKWNDWKFHYVVSARAGRAGGAAADAAVQPAAPIRKRNRTSRTPIRGRRA